MKKIKIISDGTPGRTYFYNWDGKLIYGISRCVVEYAPDQLVTATVTFIAPEFESLALWDEHPLKQWADRKTGKV